MANLVILSEVDPAFKSARENLMLLVKYKENPDI